MKRVFLSFIIIAVLLCVSACAPDTQKRQPDMPDSAAASDTPPPTEQKPVETEEPSTSLEDIYDNEPETSDPSVEIDYGDIVRIPETVFIAMINEIYLNAEDYMGRSICYEGFFMTSVWEETNQTYNYVVRYGPGCHAFDAFVGFEVIYDRDCPQENDWVEVIGVLEEYEEDSQNFFRLRLSSMTVLDTRGVECVYH